MVLFLSLTLSFSDSLSFWIFLWKLYNLSEILYLPGDDMYLRPLLSPDLLALGGILSKVLV